MHQAKIRFESEVANKSKSNLKAFESHVRSKLKTRSDVALLQENDNGNESVRLSDEEKANIPQEQFSTRFYMF